MGIVWLWGRPDEPRQIGRGLAFVVAPVLRHAGWSTLKALGDRSGICGDLVPLIVSVASLSHPRSSPVPVARRPPRSRRPVTT